LFFYEKQTNTKSTNPNNMYAKHAHRTNKATSMSCKFCKDAGKSEQEYTSHFLRESKDPNSRITCPTLLTIECRFCFKKGHTVSKCEKLAKHKNGQPDKKIPDAPMKKEFDSNTCVYAVNQFDLLSEFGDSDGEDNTVTTCQDCDTASSVSSNDESLVTVPTYADILIKPRLVRSTNYVHGFAEEKDEIGSRLSILKKAKMMRSWADSDSDEE
jgi:hypothetical protein